MCYSVVLPPKLPRELSEGGFQWVPHSLDSVTCHDVTTWAMSLQVFTKRDLTKTCDAMDRKRCIFILEGNRVQALHDQIDPEFLV